jgi:hypothetical protein
MVYILLIDIIGRESDSAVSHCGGNVVAPAGKLNIREKGEMIL